MEPPPPDSAPAPASQPSGHLRHRLIGATALAALAVGLLLTVRVADHPQTPSPSPAPDPELSSPDKPQPASGAPEPPPDNTPPLSEPSPTPPPPPPPPDPAAAAAAHGANTPARPGAIRFTCARAGAGGASLSRRSWSFDPALNMVTSLDENLSYSADNVTPQLAGLDAKWREDSVWFLLPFRLAESAPDPSGAALRLDNGGPGGETLLLTLDQRGLLQTITISGAAPDQKPSVLHVNEWLEFKNAPGLKLPASLSLDDGSRIDYEDVLVTAPVEAPEAEQPEAWPSVEAEDPAPAPPDEGG